ncbi:hypothetical protein [Salmonirosea aquatica]|uniref:Lipoprotein n=1 Tax=Salmonirosea aquatica TaxID=2654236 RepID=A0A7C9FDH6_9BACT|nr:hypothetical protein [Cytophagaceae bacterium SJW1-29]
MKHFTLLLGIGLIFFSCQSDRIGPKPVEKVIKYKESIELPNGELTFAGVEDGRCPQELLCIWGGSVVIDLGLRSAKYEKTLKLILGQGSELQKAQVSLDGTTYLIEFIEVVSPTYRSSENPVPKEKYIVKLKIQTIP